MSRGCKVQVQFSSGESRVMTLRELCGWARIQAARVRTDDGWPVVNGRILTLGIESMMTGIVRSPERSETIATWQILPRSRVRSNGASSLLSIMEKIHQAYQTRLQIEQDAQVAQAEQAWAVRS